MEDAYKFWERVDLLKNELSLVDISKMVGMNYATLKDKRTRCSYPRIDLLKEFARVLNTSIDYLLTGEEPDNLQTEMAFVRDNSEARALVRLMMEDPSILPHISALVMAGKRNVKVMGKKDS